MESIRIVATKAIVLLGQCERVLTTHSHVNVGSDSTLILSETFGRFRIWAGNLGVFQDGHASLDWRLQDSSNMSRRVLRLLHDLNEDLGNSMVFCSFDLLC
jgi:hypothetical protein